MDHTARHQFVIQLQNIVIKTFWCQPYSLAAIRPSYAFPGGRVTLPDDQSRIIQNHPRLDTVEQRRVNAAKEAEQYHHHAAASASVHPTPRGMGGLAGRRPPVSGGGRAAGGVNIGLGQSREDVVVAVEGVVTAPAVTGVDALAMAMNPALGRDSAKESSNDNSPENGNRNKGEAMGETTRGVRMHPMGGVGGGVKGKRGRATAGLTPPGGAGGVHASSSGGGAGGGGGYGGAVGGVLLRNLEPPGAARNDEAREAARSLGSKRQQAEAAFQKPVSERDVADAVVRRAGEEAAATPLIGSRRVSASAKLCFFLVALAVAALPAAHRRVHGVAVFGGRERVTLCVDQLIPESVVNLVGFAKCSKLVAEELEAARAREAALANNGTAAPPAPEVGAGASVQDLVLTSTSAGQVGSTAGHVIVGGGILWMSVVLYATLMTLRWLASRCYEHYLRLRLFAACTDPAEAALMDVPYLNLRHAWLPWLRVRLHLNRLQHLERRWAELAVAHLALAVAGLLVAAGLSAARIFTSPYQGIDLMLPMCLTLALLLCVPLALILSIAGKVHQLQEDDEALVAEEKWKMTLDGVDSWQKHAAMTDLGDVVRRRNTGAWPKMLGVRCGAGVGNAAAALAVCVFVVLAGVVALELGGGLKEGTSGDQLRNFVEVNFAYTHKFSERLLDKILRLSDNVTRVETGVTLSNDLISGLDNASPKAALEIVRDMQRCHDCQTPADGDQPRPWYADANVAAVRDNLNQHFYKKLPKLSDLCPADVTGRTRQAWCDSPVSSDPPLGKSECTNIGFIQAECTNLQYPPSPPPAPPPSPPPLPGSVTTTANTANATVGFSFCFQYSHTAELHHFLFSQSFLNFELSYPAGFKPLLSMGQTRAATPRRHDGVMIFVARIYKIMVSSKMSCFCRGALCLMTHEASYIFISNVHRSTKGAYKADFLRRARRQGYPY
jgi:hypothetical protein